MVTSTIRPLTEIGAHRPLCQHQVRVAAGLKTDASQRGAYQRRRLGVPVDQCGRRGDFTFDGRVLCRAHAGAEALRLMLAAQPRTDAQEVANPRCGCPGDVVDRAIFGGGICGKGGCPYGGDL
jgi:hypothetical protein